MLELLANNHGTALEAQKKQESFTPRPPLRVGVTRVMRHLGLRVRVRLGGLGRVQWRNLRQRHRLEPLRAT
jgi:hypothetical protein